MITEADVLKVLAEKHGVMIGEVSAEKALNELKRLLAEITIPITGRNLRDGLKMTVELSAGDFCENPPDFGSDSDSESTARRF